MAKRKTLRRLGNELERQRKRRGLRLCDVADAVGTTPATLCKYEQGQLEPGAVRLVRLAEVLGLNLGRLPALLRAA